MQIHTNNKETCTCIHIFIFISGLLKPNKKENYAVQTIGDNN